MSWRRCGLINPRAFTLDDHCERTLPGLKARPRLQKNLEEQAIFVGKLILPMRRHEIAERDRRHKKPFWISVGNDVFDISNFPFESENHQNLTRKFPGGKPWRKIVKDGTINYDQLVLDLKPYRCAVVASQTPEKGPGPADEFHCTQQEVACHIYPEATMYTIIRGQVYDLTGYMEFHPGGEKILRQWAGTRHKISRGITLMPTGALRTTTIFGWAAWLIRSHWTSLHTTRSR
jgi:cytochrome b involved in lipid metabolism